MDFEMYYKETSDSTKLALLAVFIYLGVAVYVEFTDPSYSLKYR